MQEDDDDDDDDGLWVSVCKFLQQYDNHKLPRVSRYIVGFAMDSVFERKAFLHTIVKGFGKRLDAKALPYSNLQICIKGTCIP